MKLSNVANFNFNNEVEIGKEVEKEVEKEEKKKEEEIARKG